MKQCFVILLLISIVHCSYGQPFGLASPGYRVEKLEYENSIGEVATTNFCYDYEGLLSGIKWDFSFGKFQQYWFFYCPV